MALTKNLKRIGAAAHAQRLDNLREIDFQIHEKNRASEQADVAREWKIMQAVYRVYGDAFVDWYDSPAVPDHGYARDRIALIRQWTRQQGRNLDSLLITGEDDADILHELVKASEYADAPASYDQPDPHAVVESYLLDQQMKDSWADIEEVEL